MMSGLIRGYDRLLAALAMFAGVAIAGMFALIVIDVTARELVGSSFNFTIGLVEYGLLYLTMLAAPYLLRQRDHIRITSVVSRLPPRFRAILERVIALVCALATALIAYVSVELLIEKVEGGSVDIRGIDFPGWLLIVPLPLGYTLVAVEFLRIAFGRETNLEKTSGTSL